MRELALALLTVAGLLGGCTPLYLPPIPTTTVRPEPRLDFGPASGLTLEDGRPELALALRSVPTDGWLALQWFGPGNREVASDSVWLEPALEGLTLRLPLPETAETAEAEPGAWRVVASFGGAVVRQFALEGASAP